MRNRWKRSIASIILLVMMLVVLPTNVVQAATYQKGSKGTSVQYLQQNLAFLGCSPGSADGSYGAKTATAVKALQKMLHMEETGIVDNELDALIKGTVRDVQTYLQKKGFYFGELDGIKGSMMAAGYKKLQKELGYQQTGVLDLKVAKSILQDSICKGALNSLQEFVERTEKNTSSVAKGIKCDKSVNLAELTKLANRLYENENYISVDALSGTAINITIKSVYSSIKSLVEVLNLVDKENVEVKTFIAGYNNDTAELAKYEEFFISMKEYLFLQKEYFKEYQATLEAAPYWVKYFNISNVVDITNDCKELIRCIENVLAEELYVIQTEKGKKTAAQVAEKEAMKVVEVAVRDYNNTPRNIPGGTPYNGLNNDNAQWCVDYVQYILKSAGLKYFDDEQRCATPDNLAIKLSEYGGTLFITCEEEHMYEGSSARISLQSGPDYKNEINMIFADCTMEVRPGDIIIYGTDSVWRFGHAGLCIEILNGGCFKTIEGNTGWNSYKDQCLNQKERSLDFHATNGMYILGVLRPNYAGTITANDVE